MSDPRIVYLELRSYSFVVSWAQHYYAKLFCEEQDKTVNLSKKLSRSDAEKFNKEEGRWTGAEYTWKPGQTTERFNDKEEATQKAIEEWQQHFPDARVLLRGNHCYSQPQQVIAGLTPEQRVELNTIFLKCDELEWFDIKENIPQVERLSDTWKDLLEMYLEET